MEPVRPLTFADLIDVERISQPAVSPDGHLLAYVVTRHDAKANTQARTIRLLDLRTREDRVLTPGPGNHGAPAFSPDGRWIAFTSDRDAEQGTQIWLLPIGGGEARRVTSGYGGASALAWAPDSRRIAFVRRVVVSPFFDPSTDPDANKREGPARAKVYGLVNPRSSARIEDSLLFRHWDAWRERRRSHVFAVDVGSGELGDLTPGDWDAPPISLGSARDHDWSPDGRRLVFVANPDAMVARSTNNSVYLVEVEGVVPAGPPRRLSVTEACDSHPRFTPDGQSVAFVAMSRPMHEADATVLMVVGLAGGAPEVYLADLDRDLHDFAWTDDGAVVFTAADRGRQSVYRLDLGQGSVVQLTLGSWNGVLQVVPATGRFVVGRQSTTEPLDLYLLHPAQGIAPVVASGPAPPELPPDAGARLERLTHCGGRLEGLTMHQAEEFWYEGATGAPQQGFLVRPPGFVQHERYPLIMLIHGGPQGAFSDEFHYRWNAQMFAAQGAVTAVLNPTGSVGFGRALTDAISRDWGGACAADVDKALDHLLASYPFLDPARVGAAGASYGGFMVNWLLGHSERFRAFVCHDGIFMAETMAWTTEELWFPTVEFGGLPHEDPTLYARWSPHHAVGNFRTPTLVVHGEQDFRCPISEGIGLFTALQVRGVPSRLLVFPDEGHWVMQPANAEVWYHEVVGWLMRYLA